MKHLYPLLALLLLIPAGMRGQEPVTVTKDNLQFGSSTMPGYSVVIPETDYKTASKEWIKMLQSGTRSKVVEKGDEITIFGAKIKDISENPVNVYSRMNEMNQGVGLRMAVELEKDKYADDQSGIREYLFDFAKNQYLDVAKNQLDSEKKKLRDLESDLSSLQKEQSRMEKSIASDKQILAEENKKLESLNNEMAYISDTTGTEVQGMGAKDPDQLKDLEKQRKKASREIKSGESRVSKAEKEIADFEAELPRNANNQESAKQKVKEQEEIVRQFESKYETIKNYKL
jgi:predicted  nucleic acid-binding Zn-ribbon protein